MHEYHGRKHPCNHFPYMTKSTVRFEVSRNASAQSLGRGMGKRHASRCGCYRSYLRYRRLVVKVKVGESSSRLCKLGLSGRRIEQSTFEGRVGGAFDGPLYSTKRVVDGILVVANQPFKGLEGPILVNARCTRPGLAVVTQCALFALKMGFECGSSSGEASRARVVATKNME